MSALDPRERERAHDRSLSANFYDAALKSAAVWAAQCINQEMARTDDPYSVVHAFKQEDGTIARMIINCPDSKIFPAVNKFKESLNFN